MAELLQLACVTGSDSTSPGQVIVFTVVLTWGMRCTRWRAKKLGRTEQAQAGGRELSLWL